VTGRRAALAPALSAGGQADDTASELHSYLQQQLDEHFGRHRRILACGRQLCVYTSSFRIEELDVRLEGGAHVRLVLKDLNREHMVTDAVRARPEFLYDSQREIGAYQWLLPHAPAGPPALYGSVTTPSAGRCWLLLEQVSGAPLWQIGDVAIWEQAAGWIARFHQAFSPVESQRLATRIGALVFDEDWYWRWLHRAQRFAAGDPGRRRVLDGIEPGFARVVARLTSLPQTLIHGEFYASNVIASTGDGVRICPVDWEMTALGPALIDLAALTAGWIEPTQRALARSYVAAASGDGPHPGRPAGLSKEFLRDLDYCRLYLAVRMLGWSDHWEPPRDHAHNWLAEAERVWRRWETHS